MNCVYCGNPITVESREHIIQNAIGGLEESTDICCPKCNNYISRFIDKPFVTTFNPIIARTPSKVRWFMMITTRQYKKN